MQPEQQYEQITARQFAWLWAIPLLAMLLLGGFGGLGLIEHWRASQAAAAAKLHQSQMAAVQKRMTTFPVQRGDAEMANYRKYTVSGFTGGNSGANGDYPFKVLPVV